jgi:hypothetical protein
VRSLSGGVDRSGGRASGPGRGWVAFALFLAVSFSYFGIRVVAHPERDVVGGLFTDPQIFIWSFAWLPHAIAHGLNPFYTHAIWAPGGFNLAWATSVPGLALAFAPLTLAFGPVLAYNVASILMPALAAWAAFLLCRRLTQSFWPALAGGYLFGFSSYMLGGQLTHIHTLVVFPIPLAALAILRFLDGELGGRALALSLAGVLLALMLTSTETLFTFTLALVCSLVLAWLLVPARRPGLRRLVAPLAAAFGLAALVAAPFLYSVFTGTGSQPPPGSGAFSADLLNFVVPTRASLGGWWGDRIARHFPGNDVERGAYIGVPTLAILCLYAWRGRRARGTWFLPAGFLLAALAALGSRLTIDGSQSIGLPWEHLGDRSFFADAMPVRVVLYATLAAAVAVSLWAASDARPRWLRIVLPSLAVLSVAPNLAWGAWARTPRVPTLFTTGEYRSCIPHGANVLLLPFGTLDDSMLWQVRSGFWFDVAGGYISPYPPPSYTRQEGIREIATEDLPPKVTTADVRELARAKGVKAIVLAEGDRRLWAPVLRPLARPEQVGGVLLYRLDGGSCS